MLIDVCFSSRSFLSHVVYQRLRINNQWHPHHDEQDAAKRKQQTVQHRKHETKSNNMFNVDQRTHLLLFHYMYAHV
jgi:hypothetical protein